MIRSVCGVSMVLILVIAGCDAAKSPSGTRYERMVSAYLKRTVAEPDYLKIDSVGTPMSAKQFNLKGDGMGIRVKYRSVGDSGSLEPHDKVLVFDNRYRVVRTFDSTDLKLR